MSLDDLIGLLVFLVFIGGPVLNGLLKRRNGSPAEPDRIPGRERRPAAPAVEQEVPRRADADVSGAEDDLQRRLEEARRRVRETLVGRDAEGTAPTRSPDRPPAPSPTPPPLAPPRRAPAPEPASLPRTQFRPNPAPLRPERRPPPARRARLGRDALLGLAPDDILAGLIWHEVLSDPPSKRRIRRPSSRRR